MQDPVEHPTWPAIRNSAAGRFWSSRSGLSRTLLMLAPVFVLAALLRLPGIIAGPPGFRHEEATVALAAQQVERGFLPIYFRDQTTALEPGFVYVANLTGQLADWGVTGPRLAAALLGIVAVVACSLWYGRTLGHVWGLAGGVLVATSFWQLAFSRQAVPAIAMAAVGAVGLWALYRATGRPRRPGSRVPSSTYGLAGLAFGFAIYTDVAMRAAVPIVLLIGVVLFFGRRFPQPPADRRGLLLGLIVMLLVAAPLASWFWQNPDSFRFGIDRLNDGSDTLESVTSTLKAVVGSGDSDPAHNIPGRPLLDPILVVWGALGLGYALRRPLEPLHAGALIWLAGFLVTAIAIAPGNHAQMLALTPALFFFPVLGMAVAVRAALERGTRTASVVITVVALSIIGSAVWSVYDYVQWTGDGETYQAFQGDIRDALEEVAALPNDGHMVYFSTGKHGRIVRYLAPERPRRDFDNTTTLPLPAEGSAYLVVPASAALHESLALYLTEESLAATGKDPDGENAYRVWFVDVRTREGLPYAVPAIFFENGPVLVGFEVSPLDTGTSQPAINVVLVYRVASGAERFWSLARLVGPDGDPLRPSGQLVQPSPNHVVDGDELILSRLALDFPDSPGMVANLHTAIQTLTGDYLTPSGPGVTVIDDTFALLNAIGYIGPAP